MNNMIFTKLENIVPPSEGNLYCFCSGLSSIDSSSLLSSESILDNRGWWWLFSSLSCEASSKSNSAYSVVVVAVADLDWVLYPLALSSINVDSDMVYIKCFFFPNWKNIKKKKSILKREKGDKSMYSCCDIILERVTNK